MKTFRKRGFTLIELIVGLASGLVILTGLISIFFLSRATIQKGNSLAEIAQNGRISLERLSRELRQAEEFVTALPIAYAQAVAAVEFQDGHAAETFTYLRYYLQNQALRRETAYYSLPSQPSTPVRFGELDFDGQRAQKHVTADEIIAEYIADLEIWSPINSMIEIKLALNTQGTLTTLSTTLYGRNLH